MGCLNQRSKIIDTTEKVRVLEDNQGGVAVEQVDQGLRTRALTDGQVFAWLLILKGVFRSLVEIWRDDDRGVFWGFLSTSQIISMPLVALGIVLLLRARPGRASARACGRSSR